MARETWATRAGFILAAVGSAVGLGNIWRFPFMTGQYGGSSSLITYLAFVALIGLPAILVEFVVGRYTNLNPVGAIRELGSGAWNYLGWLFVAIGFVILSYYSVIAGWFLRYTLIGVTEGYALAGPEQADALFVGWVVPDTARAELEKGISDLGGLGTAWIWIVRIPIVVVVIVSLSLRIVDYADFLTGDFADWLAAR